MGKRLLVGSMHVDACLVKRKVISDDPRDKAYRQVIMVAREKVTWRIAREGERVGRENGCTFCQNKPAQNDDEEE